MRLKLTAVSLGVIVFAAIAFASLDVVRLAWTPKKGTTTKYTVRKAYETEFAEITYEFTSVVRVETIVDGKVVLSTENSSPTVTSDGPSGCAIQVYIPTLRTTYSRQGEYLSTEKLNSPWAGPGQMTASQVVRFGHMSTLVLPDKPIKKGDSWVHAVNSNSNTGALAAKGTYKYLGTERIDKWSTYKISFQYQESGGEEWQRMSATGTKWISTEDGSVVQEKVIIINAQIAVHSVPMEIDRKKIN